MPRRSRTTTLRLRTGDEVLVRPIAPDDKELLARSFERLSEQTRYRRFFAPVSQLSPAQLRYLTEVDHHDHEALVALSGEDLVAVARYVRSGEEPDAAEVAVTVADDWQGRGLGSALLGVLVDRARQAGITTITAVVQRDNVSSLKMLGHVGEPVAMPGGTTTELRIALPERGVGAQLERLMRATAAGTVVLAGSALVRAAGLGRPAGATAPLDPDTTVRVIVAGTDGSASARESVRTAVALAAELGATVHLVSSYNRLAPTGLRGARRWIPEDVSTHGWLVAAREDAEKVVAAGAREAARPGVTVHTHVLEGEPADVLIRAAEEHGADLIVVGAKGMRSPARFLLGSVADKVARHAPCSVLVARPAPVRSTSPRG